MTKTPTSKSEKVSKIFTVERSRVPKDDRGKWKKGFSGNPGGVSKEKRFIIDLCKDMGEDAVNTLYNIMVNPDESGKVRIHAAVSILDRGYGKPGIRKDDEEQNIENVPVINIITSKEEAKELTKQSLKKAEKDLYDDE